jgi:putative phosphoesterase
MAEGRADRDHAIRGETGAALIGLISDTHGKLRASVLDHFAGVDLILHAGDIGGADILIELETVAPVHAVWGNTDGAEMRRRVGERVEVERGGARILVVHGHQLGSPTPELLAGAYPGHDIVVFGHTHRPTRVTIGSRLFINPGSAGAARFGLSPSIALLRLGGTAAEVEPIELE